MFLIFESKLSMTTIAWLVLVNTCHVSKEKCKASLNNVICNEDNLQVDYLKNVHTN